MSERWEDGVIGSGSHISRKMPALFGRARYIVLAAFLLALVDAGDLARAAHFPVNVQAYRETGPQTIAYGSNDAGRVEESDRSRNRGEGTGVKLFDEVMRIVHAHFVRNPSSKRVFENTLKKLVLVLPPHCTEGTESFAECSQSAEQCFIESLRDISHRCDLEMDRLVQTALRMLLHGLDRNTGLLDATMIKELKISMSGRFGGVGMVVTERDGDYVVISPFDGSPAYRAGIRAGDTIVEIDGHPLHGLPLLEVLRLVRGPAGSRMKLTVRSEKSGKTGRVRLRRRVIRIPPVRSTMLSKGIGYLRIVNFQNDTAEQVKKALNRMFRSGRGGLKGLILDVRDNPGGLFTEAIQVADLFLSSGCITSIRGRDVQTQSEFTAQAKGTFPEIPIVILMNKGSASGSEILVGALQGRSHVLVLGERSFGKASVQAVFPLGKGKAVRLTTAHYYTADGRDIDGKGLEPDVPIEMPENLGRKTLGALNAEDVEVDAAVQKALEYLQQGEFPRRSPFSSWY